MSDNNGTQDIFSLEFTIRDKLQELSWKTEALEESKKELSKARQKLGELNLALDDERRRSSEMKRQLLSVVEISHLLEKENTNYRSERHQLQVNHDVVLRERDSLLEQTRLLKSQNMQLTHQLQELQNSEKINAEKLKNLEQQFHQTVQKIKQDVSSIDSNILKYAKEQGQLRKSVEGVSCLNKRLQTIALCVHGLHKQQENQIQNLRHKIVSAGQSEQTFVSHPPTEPQTNPQLLMSEMKLQEKDLEDELKKFLVDFEGFEQR